MSERRPSRNHINRIDGRLNVRSSRVRRTKCLIEAHLRQHLRHSTILLLLSTAPLRRSLASSRSVIRHRPRLAHIS